MRVNKNMLNNQVNRINEVLKENNKDIVYRLEIAYGGYRLVKCVDKGVYFRSHRLTAREMYYTLNTLELALIDLYY